MLVDYIRQIHAKQRFKIKDDFKFIEFHDVRTEGITEREITETSPVPDDVEIWAAVQIFYSGQVPESYKAINLIIGDWVLEHDKELTETIHKVLKDHFEKNYPGTDTSELDGEDSVIWFDQLDYMPRINPDDKSIIIEVELVMDTEALGEVLEEEE